MLEQRVEIVLLQQRTVGQRRVFRGEGSSVEASWVSQLWLLIGQRPGG